MEAVLPTKSISVPDTNAAAVRIAVAYAFCTPAIAMQLPKVGGVGAADLLMPFGLLLLLVLPLKGKVQTAHVGVGCFLAAAAVSLFAIPDGKMMIDCAIRWVRLIGIIVPFFFGLVVRPSKVQLQKILLGYGLGGFLAVAIGIFLYVFQIETREGQQRLWMDGGSMLRAGGLIGNSGAFGHMTATWCLISCLSLALLTDWKYRIPCIGVVLATAGYAVIGASSRAAMLHMLAGTAMTAALVPSSLKLRRRAAILAVVGLLGLVVLVTGSRVFRKAPSGGGSNATQAQLARFIPGMGGGSTEFTSNRMGNWPEFFAMIAESCVIGTGYKTGVRMHEESPDNSVLSVFLETGVIGLMCMSLFVIGTLHRLVTLYCVGDKFATMMLIVSGGQLINCATSDIYTFWITMPVVYMLLGLALEFRPAEENA
jgi:hypothetical protein